MDNKICVYAICKNESKFVDTWLKNMSEADYIVVLDTGSTDGTFEMLQNDKRVTRVKQKIISPWRFDVARNESMKLIPKDANILVCTDFDEQFEPGWAKVVKDNWGEKTNRIFYTFAWSHNEAGEPTDVFKYDKIHDRNFKWMFPVHEVLEPKDSGFIQNVVDVGEQVYLHHFQDKEKSRSSYFDLLKLSVKENPEDSHVRMLLAREYLLRSEYKEALNEYLDVLRMPDVEVPEKRLVLLESLGRAAQLYQILENYDEGLWYCQEFIKEDPTYREPYFMMAEMYNEMKMYTLGKVMVEAGLNYGTRKSNWIERADTWVSQADDILSCSEFYLGNFEKAINHVKEALKHHPNDPRLLKNYSIFLETELNNVKEKIKN